MFSGPKAILRVKSFQGRRKTFELPALKALQLIWGPGFCFGGVRLHHPKTKANRKPTDLKL